MGATLRRPKIESIVNEIDDLKSRVETMLHDQVTPVLSDAASRARSMAGSARHFAGTATDTANEQMDMVAGHVRGNPLTAVLLAAGIGYIIGRFTTSR
jgi:ElaB/YqjD/DUF883 family membrane-anchored ribosome-binding protein